MFDPGGARAHSRGGGGEQIKRLTTEEEAILPRKTTWDQGVSGSGINGARRRHQPIVFVCFYLSCLIVIHLFYMAKPARNCLDLSDLIQQA